MLNKYEYKILDLKSLKSKVGPFPRNKKVIMCHGVFDIVHPGHIRHLSYAKSKADILIASITTDKHVKKGRYRPHVPENLRALNLAAFDMVDFVYIDNEEKPLNTIREIRPDYFAKGYEYDLSAKFRNEATFEEENELLISPTLSLPSCLNRYFDRNSFFFFLGGGGLNYINCFNEIKKKQQQQQKTKPIQSKERLLTTLLLCSELLVWGFSFFFPEIFL